MAAQSFAGRLLAVFGGELVNKGSVVVAFMWLARTLDSASYGAVEWALSITMVMTLVADAGLATWAAARVAAEPEETPRLIAGVGRLRLLLAAPSYLVIVAIAMSYGGDAGAALAVYGLGLWFSPFLLQYLFNGLLRTGWAALGNATRGVTFVLTVILLVGVGSQPVMVAIAEVVSVLALAICNVIVFGTVFRIRFRLSDGREPLSLLESSWRIGATEVTWAVHWYAGLILLGYLLTTVDAAWHSASLRLVMAIHTGVWLYLYVLLPNLARVVHRDPDAWTETVSQSLRLASWAGCAIAIAGTLAAAPILTLVFGPSFIEAVPTFRAAIWVVPIAWLSGHIRYSLIAAQQQQRDYHAALIGAATTIALTILLAPLLRSTGAGLALLGGTIANAVAALVLSMTVLPRCAYFRVVRTSLLAALICLVLGLVAAPHLGDVGAAIVATGGFVLWGSAAERASLGKLHTMFVGGLGPTIGSANDSA